MSSAPQAGGCDDQQHTDKSGRPCHDQVKRVRHAQLAEHGSHLFGEDCQGRTHAPGQGEGEQEKRSKLPDTKVARGNRCRRGLNPHGSGPSFCCRKESGAAAPDAP